MFITIKQVLGTAGLDQEKTEKQSLCVCLCVSYGYTKCFDYPGAKSKFITLKSATFHNPQDKRLIIIFPIHVQKCTLTE